MKLKENLITALLLAMGLIMHQLVPGILFGMKFDFLLIFMFIAMLINPSRKNIVLSSLMGGLISAMTTSFPGGQLPNIIDKLMTGLILYLPLQLVATRDNKFYIGLLGLVGTLISGSLFLIMAGLLTEVNIELFSLIKLVVLPTSLINSLATVFLYSIVKRSLRLAKTN